MEAVEPTRPIIMRRGGLQQQQQQQEDRSSTWSPFAFAPSWIQTGIQSLKQSVFGPSNPLGQQQQETQGSLLGKRSEPADDRDYGPTPKRPRLQSPPAQARSDSMEAQPNSVCPLLIFPCSFLSSCSSHWRPQHVCSSHLQHILAVLLLISHSSPIFFHVSLHFLT